MKILDATNERDGSCRNRNGVLEFVFQSGRSTLQMQEPKEENVATLKEWLQDIKLAFGAAQLTPPEIGVVNAAKNRIFNALEYKHNRKVPYRLVFSRTEVKIDWYLKTL